MEHLKFIIVLFCVSVFSLGFLGCEVSFKDSSQNKQIRTLSDGRVVFPSKIVPGDAFSYLKVLQKEQDYHIIIDCFGGSAHDTIVVINRIAELQHRGFKITTEAYGYTLSGGAFIFIMGDKRIIHEGATLMFHGAGFGGSYNFRKSLRNYILTGRTILKPDVLKALSIIDNKFFSALRSRIGLTLEEIYTLLYEYNDNYISSEDAIELGIATEVR